MELQLKNIGMIKEANVKIDGLTIIAGENDTGKSTVGKALYTLLRAKTLSLQNNSIDINVFKQKFDWISKRIFKNQIFKKDSYICIENTKIDFENNSFEIDDKYLSAILIESPLIWNLYEFFNSVAQIAPLSDASINYPYINWDLFSKLANKRNEEYALAKDVIKKINNVIDGDFIHRRENFKDKYVFLREEKEFELDNVAMGIKSFGIILALIKNNYITKKRILIFDEPEVHLHPKWQLEMAKILVELVVNGVKIVVNSHSPYMIEALEILSKRENINANFYLAIREKNYAKIEDVSLDLSTIYDLLSQPIDTLENMELDNFKW